MTSLLDYNTDSSDASESDLESESEEEFINEETSIKYPTVVGKQISGKKKFLLKDYSIESGENVFLDVVEIFHKKTDIEDPVNYINKNLTSPLISDKETSSTQFEKLLDAFSEYFKDEADEKELNFLESYPESFRFIHDTIERKYGTANKNSKDIAIFLYNINLLLKCGDEAKKSGLVNAIEQVDI